MVYLAQTGQHWWKDVESHWLCGIPQRCRWIAFVWLTMGIPNHPLHNTIYGGNVTYQRARWSLLDKCPGVDLGFMVNMFCNLAKMFWCIDLKSSLNGVKCLLLHHLLIEGISPLEHCVWRRVPCWASQHRHILGGVWGTDRGSKESVPV